MREVSKTDRRLYDAISIKLGLGSSYVSQRALPKGKDCLVAKQTQRVCNANITATTHVLMQLVSGLWQSLEKLENRCCLDFS